jgi:hypothetical protein
LSIFLQILKKIKFVLKPDQRNSYFEWRRLYIYDNIWLNSSWNEKCFRQKLYRKSKHTLSVLRSFS